MYLLKYHTEKLTGKKDNYRNLKYKNIAMTPYQLPINLLIVDDHQLITDGLSKILETEKIINEIYIAHNGKEAVDNDKEVNDDNQAVAKQAAVDNDKEVNDDNQAQNN